MLRVKLLLYFRGYIGVVTSAVSDRALRGASQSKGWYLPLFY